MSDEPSAVLKIDSKIYLIRGERVMLDHDLAALYGVLTKRLNEQVVRNSERFPSDFMFLLTIQELKNLRSHAATSSSGWGGRRVPPRAFTEQGVAMLASVLQSARAVQANIGIMRAFVQMRRVLVSNKEFELKLNELEAKYGIHDQKFRIVFNAIKKLMDAQSIPHKQVIGLGKERE